MTDTAPRGTRIAHVGLAVAALDQILPFYRDVLGMVEVPLDDATSGLGVIGQDVTDDINYFGSANAALIAADFHGRDARREFTVTRTILWESQGAAKAEVTRKEIELILLHRANDPAVGYNRWPPFK